MNFHKRVAVIVLGFLLTVVATVVPSLLIDFRAEAATRKTITLTFWSWWDGERQPWMENVIKHFEEQYPWIKVEPKIQGWTGINAKIMTAFAAGVPPEVTMTPRAEVLALADLGAIIPITPYVQRDKLDLSMFYPAEVETFRYRGELWTLPLPTATANDDFYYYNKAMFERSGLNPDRPPETWSSFMEAALKLNRRDSSGRYTQLFVYPGPHMYLDFLFSNNGDILTPDLRREAITSQASKEALQYLYDLGAKAAGPQAGPFINAANGTVNAFYTEKVATLFENVSVVRGIIDLAIAKRPLDWGVGLIPYNDRNPQARSTGVAARGFGWGYVIPKGLPKDVEEAAWLWVKFLTTDEWGTGYFSFMMGRPSPVRKFNQRPEYRKINPNFDRILMAMETDKALPALPIIRQIVDTIVNNLWGVASGTSSPFDAANTIGQNVQNQLDKYWASRK